MNFKARLFNPEDANLMQAWLSKRGINDVVDLTYMPPNGFVILSNGKPVCLGFVILCDNKMAINSDLISDPDVPKEERNAAVEYLRRTLYAMAIAHGCRFVTAFTKHKKLQERLEGLGFQKIDSNLTQIGRVLWP